MYLEECSSSNIPAGDCSNESFNGEFYSVWNIKGVATSSINTVITQT